MSSLTLGFLIMGLNFKTLFVMVVMTWQCFNISDSRANIAVKVVDYPCIIHGISKYEGIHLLEHSMLDDCGNIPKSISKEINIKNRH